MIKQKTMTDIERLWRSHLAQKARELNDQLVKRISDAKAEKTDVYAKRSGPR